MALRSSRPPHNVASSISTARSTSTASGGDFFHAYCGALDSRALSNGRVAIWGPGWPGWNSSGTLVENIKARWPETFDLLVLDQYEPNEVSIPGVVYATLRDECVFHEMDDQEAEKWTCRAHGKGPNPWKLYDIVLLKYKKDFTSLFQHSRMSDPEINNDKSLISLWHHGVLPGSYVRLLNSGTNHDINPNKCTQNNHSDQRPAKHAAPCREAVHHQKLGYARTLCDLFVCQQ
jgi:hypothetical protein